MIGGFVTDTVIVDPLVWIACKDADSGDEAAVFVEESAAARCISEGDSIWWEGGFVMWTPKMRTLRGPRDVKLVKVGASGKVAKPKGKISKRPIFS